MSLECKTPTPTVTVTVTVTVLVQFTVWTLPKNFRAPLRPAAFSLRALTWPTEEEDVEEEEDPQQQLPGEAINIFQLFA